MAKQKLTHLEKARAMKCFGKFIEIVEPDPDPNTPYKALEAFNCKNCDNYKYCCKLADTLR